MKPLQTLLIDDRHLAQIEALVRLQTGDGLAALALAQRRARQRIGIAALLAVLAVALLAIAGAAHAAWEGHYDSAVKQRAVSLRLTPAEGSNLGELAFLSEDCAVGLRPTTAGQYLIVPLRPDQDPGPYCGSWLGGRVEAALAADTMALRLVSRSGRSAVSVSLRQP